MLAAPRTQVHCQSSGDSDGGTLHINSALKPNNWVMRHQPGTLDEEVVFMEAYALVEVGTYPKSWKNYREEEVSIYP